MQGSGSSDEELDSLLRAYREESPDPEPGAGFMPGLWRRIESRQRAVLSFDRMVRGFVTAAAALAIAIGAYVALPRTAPPVSGESYLEALAEANTLDTPENVGPVRLDLNEPSR